MPRGVFSHFKEKTDTMSAYLPYESIYYEKIADFYKFISHALLAFLAIFVAAVIIFCNQDLRAENFRYLFKYIDVDPISTSSNYKDIYYDSNDNTIFTFYKGDLAVICDGKLKLYNIAGKNILDEKMGTENALCSSDGKYLITYYPGENSVSVFNSFSKLYTISYDYPVMYASAGKNGSFAVITRNKEYRSAVYIYNNSFKSVYTWLSNEKYALSAAISPNGKNVAVITYSQYNGTYLREITVRNISADSQELSVATQGEMPIKIGFFEDENMYAVYADGISFYDERFNKITSVSVNDTIQFYRTFADGILLVTGETKANAKVHYYDSKGNEKLTENFQFSVLDADILDGTIYLLTTSAIYKIDSDGVECAEISGGAEKIFLFDDGNVLVCYSDHTCLVRKNDFK